MADDDYLFSHLDKDGQARMVDVGEKAESRRFAVAAGHLQFSGKVAEILAAGKSSKGDIFTTAKIAGIMAAKRTSDIIPLCHPLSLSLVEVEFELDSSTGTLRARAEVRTTGRTGVEMEALVAVSTALLTVYDMCKSADRAMRIGEIRLLKKEGGKSGDFEGA